MCGSPVSASECESEGEGEGEGECECEGAIHSAFGSPVRVSVGVGVRV